jgi:hypothetical protein
VPAERLHTVREPAQARAAVAGRAADTVVGDLDHELAVRALDPTLAVEAWAYLVTFARHSETRK